MDCGITPFYATLGFTDSRKQASFALRKIQAANESPYDKNFRHPVADCFGPALRVHTLGFAVQLLAVFQYGDIFSSMALAGCYKFQSTMVARIGYK